MLELRSERMARQGTTHCTHIECCVGTPSLGPSNTSQGGRRQMHGSLQSLTRSGLQERQSSVQPRLWSAQLGPKNQGKLRQSPTQPRGQAEAEPQSSGHTRAALRGVCGHSDKHATGKFPEAQCAFKILMIHEVLQFALRIAFRCVLHRCGSLDIRC